MFDDWSFAEMLEKIEQKIRELESQIALEPKRTNFQLVETIDEFQKIKASIKTMMREQEKVI